MTVRVRIIHTKFKNVLLVWKFSVTLRYTAQKIKLFIKNFFSKCDEVWHFV